MFKFGNMRHIFITLIAMALCLCVDAKSTITRHENEVAGGYNFILAEPDSIDGAMPLIITLYSRGSSGKNLADVDKFGTIDAIQSGVEIDAYVLAPQAAGADWDTEKVIKDVDWVIANRNIDTNRIYAIGMSMGGNGVADLAAAYPGRIAAAMILAGALTKGDAANLGKMPLWVVRGLDDREEAISRTDDMVKEIENSNSDSTRLIYSKVKGLDHRQHERILYIPYFYQWLMSHNLQESGRPVHTGIEITSKMLKNAYKGLELREESAAKRKSRRHGPRGPMGPRRW